MYKKYFSKITAIISIIALLLLAVIPAFAEENTVKVKVDIAGADGKLYVRLTAPADSDLTTFSSYLKFDSEKLEYQEVSFLDDENVGNSVDDSYIESDVIGAGTFFLGNLAEESKIFTYIFNIADGAQGDCTFQISVTEAEDSNGNRLNIILDGPLTASLSSLEPLTPDKIQSSYEPTTTTANVENADSPSIPNTTKKIVAISVAAIVLAAAVAGATFVLIKKKNNPVAEVSDEGTDEKSTDIENNE